MTLFPSALVILFGLVGAHVPKAFTLLYLILAITCVRARWFDAKSVKLVPARKSKGFRVVQLLVLLFSFSYPLAMLQFGFWQLSGRQLLDVVSAVLLPSGLFWWGAHMARRDLRLFSTCLFSYSIGALIFLLSALLRTRGFAWFEPTADPGSLMMAWGSEASMNVRSVEQNGILNVVLVPIGIWLLLKGRYFRALLMLTLAIVGWLSVLPLLNGRLWTVSLALACLPLICCAFRSIWNVLGACCAPWQNRLGLPILLSISGLSIAVLIHHRASFCDERFAIYSQALRHWPDLIFGGRTLSYDVLMCDGLTRASLSLHPGSTPSFAMLHNVFLDVLATVGGMAALPMFLFLMFAVYAFVRFAYAMSCRCLWSASGISLQLLWCFLCVIVPQWFFQPLIYGDGLLYYLSYAVFAGLLAIDFRGHEDSRFLLSA